MSTSNRIPVHDRVAFALDTPQRTTALRSWLCTFKERTAKFAFGICFSDARLSALANLDPRHFGESGIASIYGVSMRAARRLCRLAVRRGVLVMRCEEGPLGPKNVYSLSESQERAATHDTDNSIPRHQ